MAGKEEHCYRCGYSWRPRRRRVSICSRCKSLYFWLPKLKIPPFGNGLGIEEMIGPKRQDFLRIARRNGTTDVRIFGSVARRAAHSASDVDILVRPISRRAFRPIDLAMQLTRLLGRHADVVTEGALHWLIEPQMLAEAVTL